MYNNISINETTKNDLDNILALWNDGEVMKYVGFPNGLGETMENLIRWYGWIKKTGQESTITQYIQMI